MAFRLARLEAAGFRGINRPLSLALAPGLTVLLGRNGAGKSSLLQAVEWALFGALPESGNPEFRREDAVVNAFTSQSRAQVRLTLAAPDETVTVERTRRLGRSTTPRSELVLRSEGQVWRDSLAQGELERRLALTVSGFHSAVMLPQDASRALAGGNHAERSATIDRLLGLAEVRELVDSLALSMPQVSREANRLAREIETQRGAGLTTAMDLRRLLSRQEDALQARQIQPAQLGPRALDELLWQLEAGLAEAARALDLAPPVWPGERVARLAAIRRALAEATQRRDVVLRQALERRSRLAVALTRLEAVVADEGERYEQEAGQATSAQGSEEGRGPPQGLRSDLANAEAELLQAQQRRDRLRGLLGQEAELAAALAASAERERRLATSHQADGSLDNALAGVQRDLDALTAEGRRQRAQAQLLNDAQEVLEGFPSEHCPLCSQPVDHAALLERLRAAIAGNQEARRLEELRARYRRLDERRRHLQEAQAALTTVQAETESLRGRLAAVRREVAEVTAPYLPTGAQPPAAPTEAILEQAVAAAQQRYNRLHDEQRSAQSRRQEQAARQEARRAATRHLATLLAAPAELPLAELQRRAAEAQAGLEGEIDAVERLGPTLARLSAEAQDLPAILDYLDLQGNVERLEGDRPEAAERLALLGQRHNRLRTFQEGLQAIHAAAVAYGEEALQRALESLLPLANTYFDRLGGHPAYAALTLQPESQRGSTVYWLLAHDADLEHATFLPTRFSHTQRHVAALALFFALARRLPHALDLLLLDDPAQSMDAARQEALATVLAQEALSRQVVVATEDEGFAARLREAADVAEVVRLGEWEPGGASLS